MPYIDLQSALGSAALVIGHSMKPRYLGSLRYAFCDPDLF